MKREAVTSFIAIVIGVTWAASVCLTYVDRDWHPPATVHLVMMALVGAIFGAKVFNRFEREERRKDETRK